MFESISNKLTNLFISVNTLEGEKLEEVLSQIRVVLFEADVSMGVVKNIIDDLRKELLGQKLSKKIEIADFLMKSLYEKILDLIGKNKSSIAFDPAKKPNVIMLVGLQGAGKTTTATKLAKILKEGGKSCILASTDIYRPAAQQQLETNAKNNGFKSVEIVAGQSPLDITKRAVKEAAANGSDYLIIDTAGRNELNKELMSELESIKKIANPIETIFVVDAMIGRKSLDIISAFNQILPLTGLIATRMDGDSRGGVVLNAKSITGLNIKFFSNGEKIDDFEAFNPERIASRIVGGGDIETIVEKVNKQMGGEDAQKKIEDKIKSGKIDFNDLLIQFEMMDKLGGMDKILGFLPFAGKIKEMMANRPEMADMPKQIAIIKSMTPKERKTPDLIRNSASRRMRITKGSGTKLADINRLVKKLDEAKLAAKKMNQLGGNFDAATISKMMKGFDGSGLNDVDLSKLLG